MLVFKACERAAQYFLIYVFKVYYKIWRFLSFVFMKIYFYRYIPQLKKIFEQELTIKVDKII